MAKRRTILKAGLAASGLPLVARAGSGTIGYAPHHASIPLYKVIYDTRYAASRLFAGHVAGLGIPTHAIRGDITDIWYRDLYVRWQQGPAAIAGLTSHEALFCLDLLARDVGMRILLQGEHRVQNNGQVMHAFTGPDRALSDLAASVDDRAHWSQAVAALVANTPWQRVAPWPTNLTSRALDTIDGDTLYSWVIAPKPTA